MTSRVIKNCPRAQCDYTQIKPITWISMSVAPRPLQLKITIIGKRVLETFDNLSSAAPYNHIPPSTESRWLELYHSSSMTAVFLLLYASMQHVWFTHTHKKILHHPPTLSNFYVYSFFFQLQVFWSAVGPITLSSDLYFMFYHILLHL